MTREQQAGVCEGRVRLRVGRVERHGLLELSHGLREPGIRSGTLGSESQQVVIVRVEIRRRRGNSNGIPARSRDDGVYHGRRQLRLYGENVRYLAIETADQS